MTATCQPRQEIVQITKHNGIGIPKTNDADNSTGAVVEEMVITLIQNRRASNDALNHNNQWHGRDLNNRNNRLNLDGRIVSCHQRQDDAKIVFVGIITTRIMARVKSLPTVVVRAIETTLHQQMNVNGIAVIHKVSWLSCNEEVAPK